MSAGISVSVVLNGDRRCGIQIANSFVDDFYAIYKRRRAGSFATLNAYLANVGSRCWIKRRPRRGRVASRGRGRHRDFYNGRRPVHGDHCTAEIFVFYPFAQVPCPLLSARSSASRGVHGNRRAATAITIIYMYVYELRADCVRAAAPCRWINSCSCTASRSRRSTASSARRGSARGWSLGGAVPKRLSLAS